MSASTQEAAGLGDDMEVIIRTRALTSRGEDFVRVPLSLLRMSKLVCRSAVEALSSHDERRVCFVKLETHASTVACWLVFVHGRALNNASFASTPIANHVKPRSAIKANAESRSRKAATPPTCTLIQFMSVTVRMHVVDIVLDAIDAALVQQVPMAVMEVAWPQSPGMLERVWTTDLLVLEAGADGDALHVDRPGSGRRLLVDTPPGVALACSVILMVALKAQQSARAAGLKRVDAELGRFLARNRDVLTSCAAEDCNVNIKNLRGSVSVSYRSSAAGVALLRSVTYSRNADVTCWGRLTNASLAVTDEVLLYTNVRS